MSKRLYEIVEIKDLKDMLNKTKVLYGNRPAFKVAVNENEYKEIKKIIENSKNNKIVI